MTDEWSIQQVARLAGTTSRTLRHYGDIGILHPSRVAGNGYRYYDAASLRRLQRILLLRQLGLGLPQIAEVLARAVPERVALSSHLAWLRAERTRVERRIAAVAATIDAIERGEEPMPEDMFDGFDHAGYEKEVTERWGADAYARGDAWWRGMSAEERQRWQSESTRLAADWKRAAARGVAPEDPEAQELAARHISWLTGIPGTPAADGGDVSAYVRGLADMYAADDRFAANYGGAHGAAFLRDALRRHVGA